MALPIGQRVRIIVEPEDEFPYVDEEMMGKWSGLVATVVDPAEAHLTPGVGWLEEYALLRLDGDRPDRPSRADAPVYWKIDRLALEPIVIQEDPF